MDHLSAPIFPLDQAAAQGLTPTTFAQHINASETSVQTWFNYIVQSEAYKTSLGQLYAQLEIQCAGLEARCGELEAQVPQNQEDRAAVEHRLIQEKTILELRLETAQNTNTLNNHQLNPPARLSPSHPHPKEFSGDRLELPKFIAQLQLKLSINADHYPTKAAEIAYSVSRLEGDAMAQAMALRFNKATRVFEFEEIQDFITFLETAFGDPDKKGTAQRELRKVTQRNREFSVYLTEFMRHASETGYNDEATKQILKEGLSSEMKTLLVSITDEPDRLQDLITLLQRMDIRMRANIASHAKLPYSRPWEPKYTSKKTPASSTSSWSPSPVYTPSPASVVSSIGPSDSASNDGSAMDLSQARRGPLSPEEKERLDKLGLCRYCKKPGHQLNKCPQFKCYNCGKAGHAAASCREPRRQRIYEITTEQEGEGKEESLS